MALTSATYASGTPAQKLEFWQTKLAEAGEAKEYSLRGKMVQRQTLADIQKQIDKLLADYPSLRTTEGIVLVHAQHARRI